MQAICEWLIGSEKQKRNLKIKEPWTKQILKPGS